MKEYIRKVAEGNDLTEGEASSAMRMIMQGEATEAQIAALLVALKTKGEETQELLGFARVMREKSLKVSLNDPDAVDLCGTGGDGAGTFNISTVASFVVAGAGVTVAKHGNRGVSSPCGSADVLRALGVNIEMPPQKVEESINKVGIGFLFAPLFHPAMKHAAKPRSEIGMKTCFNLLGPMTNPAGVRRQLIGAFSRVSAAAIAQVMHQLQPEKVLVVTSQDGLDEVSLQAPTTVFEVNGTGSVREYELQPGAFCLPPSSTSSLKGGSPETNAQIALQILQGKQMPQRNVVVANAALGLVAAGRTDTLREAVRIAEESIDTGSALKRLDSLRTFGMQ